MDFIDLQSQLPIGCHNFAVMRNCGVVYVDKTYFVYQIARKIGPQLLTRPRRFGKSTLMSTLDELFRHGVKPLDDQHDSPFKGLAIERLWQDQGHYLVLHLDFYTLCTGRTAAQFRTELMESIASFCHAHALTVPDNPSDFGAIFNKLLEQLEPQSLVLLIDEYDAPLIRHLTNQQELGVCKDLMSQLFSAVKSYSGQFRSVLFTGITRFEDLELGTSGDNFTDLSMDPLFATCCGYTRDELQQYFAEHLRYAAAIRNGCVPEAVSTKQIETLLDDMSDWYDSYSFDGSRNTVFSTWSVLRFFADVRSRLQPYWSAEKGLGLPQVLKIAVERIDVPQLLEDMKTGELVVNYDLFMESSLINPEANPYSMLFQTGYLTISQPFNNGDEIHLSSPNREIDIAFGNLLSRRVFNAQKSYSLKFIRQTIPILASLDLEQMCAHLDSLFEDLPYDHYPVTSESVVQGFIFFHLRALGLKPRLEVMTSSGRDDCVFDLPAYRLTIVFEFKYESSADSDKLDAKLAEAEQQIKKHKYGLNASSEMRVARFALVFCSAPGKRGFARASLVDVLKSDGTEAQ